MEVAAANEKIGAVQAAQLDHLGEPLYAFCHRVGGRGVDLGGLRGAAVAEGLARRRRRPLCAETQDHGAMPVGEENCRTSDATDAALEVKGPSGAIAVGRAAGCAGRLRRLGASSQVAGS